jgi:putative membrane protein
MARLQEQSHSAGHAPSTVLEPRPGSAPPTPSLRPWPGVWADGDRKSLSPYRPGRGHLATRLTTSSPPDRPESTTSRSRRSRISAGGAWRCRPRTAANSRTVAENPSEPASAPANDVSRRTWLAAERTWLAWWRTGLGAGAVAIAIGRIVPGLDRGSSWPLRVAGVGFGVLAVAVLIVGAVRQRRTADALRRGSYEELSTPLVMWFTAAAVLLSIGAVTLVAVRF